MKYGLSDQQLNEITEIIASYSNVETAILFGSRASDTFKEASDVDIAIKGEKADWSLAATLKEHLEEETYLPFFFDIISCQTITNEELIKHINIKGIVIYRRGLSEWKECKLGEIAQLEKNSWKVGDEDLPYIALEHIVEGGLRLQGIGDSKTIASNKFLFNSNCFLFGKLRPYFRKLYRPDFEGICSTDIWVIKPKGENDKDFLFYFFANQKFVDFTYSGSSGTRMPRADWKFVSQSKWDFPPLPEQKAIASVLSSLDDKIDLLHRQNKTLEALAETLFRQWFVEEAQEDWEKKSLLDAIQLVGGGTPKTSMPVYWDGDIPWLSGGDISSNHKSFIYSSEKKISEAGLSNSSAKLLPQYATVISARGTVGKYCILSEPMTFSQSNYGILPKYENCFFFTYLLINHVVEELQASAYGSVFDTITTTTFKENIVQIPHRNEIQKFENSITSYFQKMLANKSQINTLEKLRDTLLPKLMSGEIQVKYEN